VGQRAGGKTGGDAKKSGVGEKLASEHLKLGLRVHPLPLFSCKVFIILRLGSDFVLGASWARVFWGCILSSFAVREWVDKIRSSRRDSVDCSAG
jgi:hypothetical protein